PLRCSRLRRSPSKMKYGTAAKAASDTGPAIVSEMWCDTIETAKVNESNNAARPPENTIGCSDRRAATDAERHRPTRIRKPQAIRIAPMASPTAELMSASRVLGCASNRLRGQSAQFG